MNERQTGTRQNQYSQSGSGAPDTTFNLVSILYHALEGGTTYDRYIQDAQQQGDQELVQFFQQTQQEERQRAERAQQLLGRRIAGASTAGSFR